MSFTRSAQEQILASKEAAGEAASHTRSSLAILGQHVIKAQMEMVKGVHEVLARDLRRLEEASAEGDAPTAGKRSAAKSRS